jgi:hypothetical protein
MQYHHIQSNDPLAKLVAQILSESKSSEEVTEETIYKISARFNNKKAKGIWQKINWSTRADSKAEAEAKFRKAMGKDAIKDLVISESDEELEEGYNSRSSKVNLIIAKIDSLSGGETLDFWKSLQQFAVDLSGDDADMGGEAWAEISVGLTKIVKQYTKHLQKSEGVDADQLDEAKSIELKNSQKQINSALAVLVYQFGPTSPAAKEWGKYDKSSPNRAENILKDWIRPPLKKLDSEWQVLEKELKKTGAI